MCGIVGYTGHRPAVPLVMEGLRHVEYRGYDSAGIAYLENAEIKVIRTKGKLHLLEERLTGKDYSLAMAGIGHIRWATHGIPAEYNAHPHLSEDKRICLVHNGIIENYLELKQELITKGYSFSSETDTEVLGNLIAEEYKQNPNLLEAFASALRRAKGAFAIAVLSRDEPGTIYAARQAAPLVLGIGTGENFIGSDVPAFLNYTKDVVFIEEGEIVRLTASTWDIFALQDLQPLKKEVQQIHWDLQSAEKGGYKHFMLKEIYEQPKALTDCMVGRIDHKKYTVSLHELETLPKPSAIRIIACGTSYHAGLWSAPLFEKWAKLPTVVEIASEFRYRDPLLSPDELVIAISQSGETADTLAALRIAKEKGCRVLGLCNAVGSTLARESDAIVYTQAGPEISVASTKALCTQMLMLSLMALHWGQKGKHIEAAKVQHIIKALQTLPKQLEAALPDMQKEAAALVGKYPEMKGIFFLGRGQSYSLALEGALKFKELTYIHAEGYAAGEIKHGPIALIEPDFLSFVVAPQDKLFPKLWSNVLEIQARRGPVLLLTNAMKESSLDDNPAYQWRVPLVGDNVLDSFLLLPALQLFSYETACYLGNDVDQPRNLAKSVTVE